jgi:hypothetical protein
LGTATLLTPFLTSQIKNEFVAGIPIEQIYPALDFQIFGLTKIRVFPEDDEYCFFQY